MNVLPALLPPVRDPVTPQATFGPAVEWATFAGFLLVPGLIATLLWSPFLTVDRIRSLLAALPPTGSVIPTYLLAGVGGSIPYIVGATLVVTTVDTAGVAWSNAFITVAVLLFVGYAAGVPVITNVVLPRLDVDWDPTGYGRSTWVLLAAGGASYALLFAIPFVVVSFLLALPGGY
ncbi:hypothetical protein SAMN05192561_101920 [Halopenitus malekzadehii]|uniref:DUF8162 domain-containing protein n=1 Tax=Halopenitus malekzadehii TaxID=1267564 RepID=A0A1H6I8M3_9EURY|nr:hypothetical protein [Halopenitus malekzadehii]SEH42565.1 hypothetical protein SAMN05192561_101920 [Halopenitus malekzadehii]